MNRLDFNYPVTLPSVNSRPTRPVLSPAASSNQQPLNEARQLLFDAQGKTKMLEVSQVKKWQLQVQGNAPTSATRPGTVTSMPTNHVKLPDPQIQTRGSPANNITSNQSQLNKSANPDPDDLVQKKRMHWRIKKQEQRARKAAREKELSQQTALNQSRHSWSNNSTHVVQR